MGLPIYQFIYVEDVEEILRGIRKAKDYPIDCEYTHLEADISIHPDHSHT